MTGGKPRKPPSPALSLPRVPSPSSRATPSPEDLNALEAFCAQVPHDDISFAQFSHVNKSLDLRVFLFVSQEERVRGGEKTLRFSRSVRQISGKVTEVRKIAVSFSVRWPENSAVGDCIRFPGLGDENPCGETGDVIVVLQSKKEILHTSS